MSREDTAGPSLGHVIRGIAQVIFIGLAAVILYSPSSPTAAAAPQLGSFRAELLHREHYLSPLRSPDQMGQAEKLRNEVRRSAARSRRLLQASRNCNESMTTIDTSVNDGGHGDYLMKISLGTPAQSFVAIADTGSTLVWLKCAPCTDCYNQSDPLYFPSLSSTYSQLSCTSSGCKNFSSQKPDFVTVTTCDPSAPVPCSYEFKYVSGTTVGNFSSETINLRSTTGENITVPDFWFGCSSNASQGFEFADGLVGLGRGPISFTSQLGHLFENKFSYCLVNKSLVNVHSSLLLFGQDAVSGAPIGKDLHYTPMLTNPKQKNLYYVGLEGILVNGVALNFSAEDVALQSDGTGGTIFDSGTTRTHLIPLVYDQFLAAVVAAVPQAYRTIDLPAALRYELCYVVEGQQGYETDFPGISFMFTDAGAWNLPFENSWRVVDDGGVAACLAFLNTTAANGHRNVFGNVQQQDFYVLYDQVNNKIGYAPTECGPMAPE